ncbi:hypothetical protein WJR50_11540 [Catalinimonas sp. 4WD22]
MQNTSYPLRCFALLKVIDPPVFLVLVESLSEIFVSLEGLD